MRFCDDCGHHVNKNVNTGEIIFRCICGKDYPAMPSDTLMAEGVVNAVHTSLKYVDFISNAPYDKAGKRIAKDCPNCKLDYLTLIRLGESNSVIYTCDCGFRATYAEYNSIMKGIKAVNKK